jgi:hypothetical protein
LGKAVINFYLAENPETLFLDFNALAIADFCINDQLVTDE